MVGVAQYYKIVATYPLLGAVESQVLTTLIPPPPQAITNLEGTSPSPQTAKVTWTCDPEATGYGIWRAKGSETIAPITQYGYPIVITQCEYIEANLWNGATYRYMIVRKYRDRDTSSDAEVSVTIQP